MTNHHLLARFGAALLIGTLIGLQREFLLTKDEVKLSSGIRTYSLLGLLGCLGARLSVLFSSVVPLAIVIFSTGVFSAINYYVRFSNRRGGMTTAVTTLLTALLGAYVYIGQIHLATAIAVTTAALLTFKIEVHRFVNNLTRKDLLATLKFTIISAIILPVLPDKTFAAAPFDIINPFRIWLLVVFISAISFIGYISIKVLGTRKGIGMTGFFGGLASSTAVTLSLAQKSRETPELSKAYAFAIVTAWTVMFLRLFIAIAAVNLSLISMLILPLGLALLAGMICSVIMLLKQKDVKEHDLPVANPFELGPAVKFGLLFVLILFISRSAQVFFSEQVFFLSSFIAGLADADAIALSLAELSKNKTALAPQAATTAIIIAAFANTFSKGMIVIISADKALKKAIILPCLSILLTMILTCTIFIFPL